MLAAWSGLGYYHRARNLHRGARGTCVERHGGRFPRTLEAALAVPGVGLYTASAVLSIAYGVPLPVVDGNVRRVLARLLALRGPRVAARRPVLQPGARSCSTATRPGDWNQALMELGATVCTPRAPACPACPVRAHCRAARRRACRSELPEQQPRRAPVDVNRGRRAGRARRAACCWCGAREGRLMGRMWEVPQTSLESRGLADLARGAARAPRPRGGAGTAARARPPRHHVPPHPRGGVPRPARREPPADAERFVWARPQALQLPVSSLTRKILRALDERQMPLPAGDRPRARDAPARTRVKRAWRTLLLVALLGAAVVALTPGRGSTTWRPAARPSTRTCSRAPTRRARRRWPGPPAPRWTRWRGGRSWARAGARRQRVAGPGARRRSSRSRTT